MESDNMIDRNTGNRNTGNRNTGDWNTGYCNTGNRNTGDCNTGNRNTGDWNTGNRNTGDRNTGDRNTGYCNTGYCNTGNRNTGDCNTGDKHVGCFNTIDAEKAYFFNQLISVEEWNNADKPNWIYDPSPTTWVLESQMTDQEKIDNPTFHTCEGYLRKNDMKDEWRKAYESASEDEIKMVVDLPGFDYDVFEEITGLDLRTKDQSCNGKVIEVDGKKYRLQEI